MPIGILDKKKKLGEEQQERRGQDGLFVYILVALVRGKYARLTCLALVTSLTRAGQSAFPYTIESD